MTQEAQLAARPAAVPSFKFTRSAGNVAGVVVLVFAVLGAFVAWQWVDGNLFGIGLEDAGQTTVDEAQLVERVKSFELVTTRDTYDTRSNTDFHKRLNLGVKTIGLPGFIAGEELDVKAQVEVAAGVDLAGITPEDIEIISNGDGSVVVVRIPQAQILSSQIDADSFDISTGQGLLNRIGSSVGLGGKDVRDGAVGAVTSLAEDEAVRNGLLTEASLAAKEQLQAFLQSLPQGEGEQVTYLVEFQAPLPH
jgi:hypothetical protein